VVKRCQALFICGVIASRLLKATDGALMLLRRLWLYPPLAFARLGSSATPCDAFDWASNDVRPRGTGKTGLRPAETLHLAADGTLSSSVPAAIVFTDAGGLRPVCPFFEIHGEWSNDGSLAHGPLTTDVLSAAGLSPIDLTWTVHVANLKPHHYTLDPGDRIDAVVEVSGDVTQRRELRGVSPTATDKGLVPRGSFLPLGHVQLTRPTAAFPELRLRFTPGAGLVYGPRDLAARIKAVKERYQPDQLERNWSDFDLPSERLILDPEAAWCRFDPALKNDYRTNPELLYAWEDVAGKPQTSLGLVDDTCDGVITCAVRGVETVARARIVVTPPHFAPDRRPFTSLADDLKDRVDRYDVLDEAYVKDRDRTTTEIRDLMERVIETVGLMNLDFQNERSGRENRAIADARHQQTDSRRDFRPFPELALAGEDPLPLTARGRERHRRFISLEVFEDLLRERPDLLEKFVREPMSGDQMYDQRMPAMVRGSDGQPMHLTRRQYSLLESWIQRLRRGVEEES
jgi:hypothetical protein